MAIFERGRSRFSARLARREAITGGIFRTSSVSRRTKPAPLSKKDTSIFSGGPLNPRAHEWQFVEPLGRGAGKGIYITPARRVVSREERKRMVKRLEKPKYGPVDFGSLRDKTDYQNLIKYLEKTEIPQAKLKRDWRKEKQLKDDIKYYKLMGGL